MMSRPGIIQQFLTFTFAVLSILLTTALAEHPQSKSQAPAIYHPDSDHLWNRLYAALFVRMGPDGQVYGQDRLEPLLWPESKHLLESASHDRAVTVLKEFVDDRGEKQFAFPLKRALLQRDLWMVFNWLEGYHDPPISTDTAREAHDQLRQLLSTAIGRLALPWRQIRELPSNYEGATTSGEFVVQFDPRQPDQPYLPADLLNPAGSWICVGRTDGITAPQHLRSENPYTNSVFLVFLRLPTGRKATSAFLQSLITFEGALVVRSPQARAGRFPFVPNARLPQFPPGTELALVRRAMLIDASNRVVASPLIENIQLRVIHSRAPKLTTQVLADAVETSAAQRARVSQWQSFRNIGIP